MKSKLLHDMGDVAVPSEKQEEQKRKNSSNTNENKLGRLHGRKRIPKFVRANKAIIIEYENKLNYYYAIGRHRNYN